MAQAQTPPEVAGDGKELARHALEQVCSRADPSAAVGVYSRDFLDHVNARDYRGHEGIAQSLALYQLLFRDGDLRSEEHTSELQSRPHLVCRLLLEKKNIIRDYAQPRQEQDRLSH